MRHRLALGKDPRRPSTRPCEDDSVFMVPVPPSSRAAGRCAGMRADGAACGTVLRRSNKGVLCEPCERRARWGRMADAQQRRTLVGPNECVRGCGSPKHRGRCSAAVRVEVPAALEDLALTFEERLRKFDRDRAAAKRKLGQSHAERLEGFEKKPVRGESGEQRLQERGGAA